MRIWVLFLRPRAVGLEVIAPTKNLQIIDHMFLKGTFSVQFMFPVAISKGFGAKATV